MQHNRIYFSRNQHAVVNWHEEGTPNEPTYLVRIHSFSGQAKTLKRDQWTNPPKIVDLTLSSASRSMEHGIGIAAPVPLLLHFRYEALKFPEITIQSQPRLRESRAA